MLFAILGSIIGYLTLGLFASRFYWQGTKSHDRDEILASLMVFFWPVILIALAGMWIVGHEAK